MMKMLKNFIPSLLLFCCLFSALNLKADDLTINGQINIPPNAAIFIASGMPYFITDSAGEIYAEGESNIDGSFTVTLDIPEGTETNIDVQVFDLCTGEIHVQTVLSSAESVDLEFEVCADLDPFPDNCYAHFLFEQTDPDNPLVVSFSDESINENDIVSWEWNFGDGNNSTEQNPTHTYTDPGIYGVTLTISDGEDCESTTLLQICIYNQDPGNCDCEDAEGPEVCVELAPGFIIPFPNACEALCNGLTEDQFMDCEEDPCGCTAEYDPVCVTLDDGTILTFSNGCMAECAGYGADLWSACDIDPCGCENVEWNEVCVELEPGLLIPFPNECEALCSGFSLDQIVECDWNTNPCGCDTDFDPTCVINADGETEFFSNPCLALCAGYSEGDFTNCEEDCICTDEYDPVCVATPFGVTITFGNACEAACEGFGPDQFVPCDGNNECLVFLFYEIDYNNDPNTVYFYGESSVDAVSYLWDFGDGNSSTEYNPVHTYVEEGAYEVVLTATTADGCESTYTEYVWIENWEPCICTEEYDPVCVITDFGVEYMFTNACYAACEGYGPDQFVECNNNPECYVFIFYEVDFSDDQNTVYFYSENLGEAVSYLWDFGDGNTSTEANPVYTYAEEGLYDIVLTITTADGCEAITSELVWIENWEPCICDDVYDPVCIATDFGEQYWFTNACFAACEGFGPDDFVDCEDVPEPCDCDDEEFEPVCVTLDDGTILPLPNACLANCFGYTEDDFVDCENEFTDPAGPFEADWELIAWILENIIFDVEEQGNEIIEVQSFVNTTHTQVIDESMNVFPNPVQDQLTLVFNAKGESNSTVNIVSVTGQVVLSQPMQLTTGENIVRLNVNDLPSGIYFAQLQSKDKMFTAKFMK